MKIITESDLDALMKTISGASPKELRTMIQTSADMWFKHVEFKNVDGRKIPISVELSFCPVKLGADVAMFLLGAMAMETMLRNLCRMTSDERRKE